MIAMDSTVDHDDVCTAGTMTVFLLPTPKYLFGLVPLESAGRIGTVAVLRWQKERPLCCSARVVHKQDAEAKHPVGFLLKE